MLFQWQPAPNVLKITFDPGSWLQEATVDIFKWIQLDSSDVLIPGLCERAWGTMLEVDPMQLNQFILLPLLLKSSELGLLPWELLAARGDLSAAPGSLHLWAEHGPLHCQLPWCSLWWEKNSSSLWPFPWALFKRVRLLLQQITPDISFCLPSRDCSDFPFLPGCSSTLPTALSVSWVARALLQASLDSQGQSWFQAIRSNLLQGISEPVSGQAMLQKSLLVNCQGRDSASSALSSCIHLDCSPLDCSIFVPLN